MLRTLIVASFAGLGAAAFAAPAAALTMKECGAKYQAAKAADTLKGQSWNDFRKAQCSDSDASEKEAAAAVSEPAAAPAATGGRTAKPTVFPSAISQKYESETPGKARLKTCADQYIAN